MTGEQFEWHLRYPGPDRTLGTKDDVVSLRHPHVPVGKRVRILLKSQDYVYFLAVPALGFNNIAVPGQTVTLEFDTPRAGTLDFVSDRGCGIVHPELSGHIVVEPARTFRTWLKQQRLFPEANRARP